MSSSLSASASNLSRGGTRKGLNKLDTGSQSGVKASSTKFSHNNKTTVSRATTDKVSETRSKLSASSDTKTTNSPNSTNDQKANSCDKLASMFDGSQENKSPILRVNLLKKSSRQTNVFSLTSRRLQQGNVKAESLPVKDLKDASETSKKAAENCNRINQTLTPSKTTTNTAKASQSQTASVTLNQKSSHYEEAKKSQKLVVSLVKDICKAVSKEDLDEMLKEIHSAIGEAQQEQYDLAESAVQISNNKATNNSSNNKKRQDQLTKKRVNNSSLTPHNSDISNSSEPRGVKNIGDTIDLDRNHISLHDKNNKKNNYKKNPNIISQALESNLNAGEIKTDDNGDNKLPKKFMDLSSDEDTVKSSARQLYCSRLPDRCLRITSSHAKYISPHRKRSLEERLSRAQEAREKFLEYRANKFRDILKKVEEMRAWKEEDTMNLKALVQTKLQKAAVKRKEQLDKIIRKAHDEDSKVSEIQFINNLEAQNRRHDMNSRKKEFEARLQDLQDERQRRFEEKQAKEAAAEERRRTLEAERKAKLLEIQQRRKLKNQKVEQHQQVREKKRIERNRNREEKMTAIKEAYNAGVQTLKKRINQKQEQSERRHEVNLRLIRQKAFELSIKRYNSFISEQSNVKPKQPSIDHVNSMSNSKQKDTGQATSDTSRRLQLKPFNTKKFCNLCKETISSESALFSHLRSEVHLSSINEHYGDTMLTTNEAVEIHNLRHIVDTDEPLDSDKGTNSDDQQSSRASSLVNYYHSSYLSQANGGICMSERDRDSLLAIEKKCRKLRHKLIVAGKPFNRDWFTGRIRNRLAQLIIQQREARNQTTNTDATSLANTIDLSANNVNCQQNKAFYLKINRINRELISVMTDQRISGGGLMPAGIIHSVDRLLADLNKQLTSRKAPQLSSQLLYQPIREQQQKQAKEAQQLTASHLEMVAKMIETYAIDTLFLYDIISCLVSILRRIVPNVSLTSKLPSTVASHFTTLIDPISLNSYYCHRSPILPARIYIKMIGLIQSLCNDHSDLCYIIFQSNNMINLSDILSYRLGFIIGNESPASSISGSSSAATLSAHTVERKAAAAVVAKQQPQRSNAASKSPSSAVASVSKYQASSGDDCCLKKGNSSPERAGEDDGDDDDEEDDEDAGEDEDEDEDDCDSYEEDNDDERDLWERTETYKRTEEIVDDMTAGLCKLLATVTETILSRPLVLLNQLDKRAFDQRSDDFISYMVSVGIVDTESVIMSHIHQQQHHHHHHHQHQQQQPGKQQQPNSSTSPNNINSTPTFANSSSDKCIMDPAMPLTAAAAAGATLPSSSPAQTLPSNSGHSLPAHSFAHTQASSANSKIINFTTSCIQFVTSLVKLVTAKLPDDGDNHQALEATQQDPTQLLATLKMTQLSGVLTLVYDMLVHSFNSLAPDPAAPNPPPLQGSAHLYPGQQVHQHQHQNQNQHQHQHQHQNQHQTQQQQPEAPGAASAVARQLGLALHSLRLINYLAYIDIKLPQSTLADDEMLPLQLRHVCSYLISRLVQSQFKILDQVGGQERGSSHLVASLPGEKGELKFSFDLLCNELMNEIILLLGNFAYLNQDNQLMLKSGRRPTIVEQLIGLPFDYFSRAQLKLVLMPTLISCAYLNDQICELVSQELSLTMLTSFIEDQLLGAQVESKSSGGGAGATAPVSALLADQLTSAKLTSNRWKFERRFAKSKWLSAKRYFEAQQARTRQVPAEMKAGQ